MANANSIINSQLQNQLQYLLELLVADAGPAYPAAPSGYTDSDLVFKTDFVGTTLDANVWNTYITSKASSGYPWNASANGGSGPGGTNDADYDLPSQVTLTSNCLNLTAINSSITAPNQGGTTTTYPFTSGAVCTYGKVEFTGGYMQILAKAPPGDGSWPGLWLLPASTANTTTDNFEIDIQEGGYTKANTVTNNNIAAGLHTPNGKFEQVVDSGIDLTTGFNLYAIDWVPNTSISWYINGIQIASVNSASLPIPNEPMQLIIDLQIANANTAGWHSAISANTPNTMVFQVQSVQLYQQPNTGCSIWRG